MKKKIGLIGFGVIGSYLFRRTQEEGFIFPMEPSLVLMGFTMGER